MSAESVSTVSVLSEGSGGEAVDAVRVLVLAAVDLNQTTVISLASAKFSVAKCSKTLMW